MSESQKQQVVQHFLNFLQSEINTGNENAESLQVAQEMLKNLYNIQTVTASNHLVELVSSSSSGAATTTTTSPASSSSSSSYNVETDVKFQEFLKLISEKGYFKNAEKGTPLYEDRFQKAKEKFITKEAEKHKDQGNALLKEHKFAQAIESYAKAIELNPANAIYYANTAVVYLQLKDYNKTIEFSKKAIQADKTYIKAYKWLAMAYEKLDMWDEAIQQYEAALQIDPQNKELETKLSQAKSRPTSSPATTSAPRQSAPSGFPGFPGMPGMPAMPGMGGGMPAGFDQILSNPNFMSMVNNIVQQPGFQQAMESMMKGFTGGGAGGEEGGAGAGGLPFDTAMLEQMPEVQQSERLQGIIKEIKAGGLPALMKYQADPEFSQLAQKVLQKTLGSGFNPFAAFGGGGAGAGGKDNDEDDSSGSMYS